MLSASNFPSGLRVLVVDDDAPTLKIVSAMLQKCGYQVTTATSGAEALEILRDKTKPAFDLVLSDVMMPDMDGFRLLELIGLELELPVIMMSSNGETHTVLRGVTHGAVDFLIKPVRLEELRNMWQHVVRRKRDMVKEESEDHSFEKDEGGCESSKKRKELGVGVADAQDDDANASKKARVVWSVDMHQQFVNAVNQLGVDKAVPKKILEIMQVEGLTRENVASHLQKYRLYLKRVSVVSASGSGATPVMPGLVGVPSTPFPGAGASGPSAMSGPASTSAVATRAGAKTAQVAAQAAVAAAGDAAAGSAAPKTPDDGSAAASMAAAANMAAANMAAAGFPNSMLGPMAALMNPGGGLNPHLLGGLGAMNPMGLGGLGQGPMPMGIPGMPQLPGLGGLPMGLPFMQGMGMPGMPPGMLPPDLLSSVLHGRPDSPAVSLGGRSGPSGQGVSDGPLRQPSINMSPPRQRQQQQQQQMTALGLGLSGAGSFPLMQQQQHMLGQQQQEQNAMQQQQQQQHLSGSGASIKYEQGASLPMGPAKHSGGQQQQQQHLQNLFPPLGMMGCSSAASGPGAAAGQLPGLLPGALSLSSDMRMSNNLGFGDLSMMSPTAAGGAAGSAPSLSLPSSGTASMMMGQQGSGYAMLELHDQAGHQQQQQQMGGGMDDTASLFGPEHADLAAAFNELYNGPVEGLGDDGSGVGASGLGLGLLGPDNFMLPPGELLSASELQQAAQQASMQQGQGKSSSVTLMGLSDQEPSNTDDLMNYFLKG